MYARRFTFLATLFVLVAVSCAIVLRSFYMRRQMRRRYEEAIAAGLLPSVVMPGARKKKNFGEKPKLYDAVVVPADGEKWEHLTVRILVSRDAARDLCAYVAWSS